MSEAELQDGGLVLGNAVFKVGDPSECLAGWGEDEELLARNYYLCTAVGREASDRHGRREDQAPLAESLPRTIEGELDVGSVQTADGHLAGRPANLYPCQCQEGLGITAGETSSAATSGAAGANPHRPAGRRPASAQA